MVKEEAGVPADAFTNQERGAERSRRGNAGSDNWRASVEARFLERAGTAREQSYTRREGPAFIRASLVPDPAKQGPSIPAPLRALASPGP